MYVSYEKNRLVSKTFGLEHFVMYDMMNDMGELMNMNAKLKGTNIDDWMMVWLENYRDKRFVIEGPVSEDNCDSPPVDGLKANTCRGIRISKASNDGNRAPGKPLENLNQEELKKLLRQILERL